MNFDKKDFMSKFKLDSHHRIERFSVLFVFFIVFFMVIYIVSAKHYADLNKVTLNTQAKYTQRSVWSLSHHDTDIEEIYRNADFSRIFVLLHVNGDFSLSMDANDYSIFMSGYKKEKLTNDPKGAVYIFGNTGYIGLYFFDTKGFDPHMYDVTLRCNKFASYGSGYYDGSGNDGSFDEYNQLRFYANFAGENAPVAKFLSKSNPSIDDIYFEVISKNQERDTKQQLYDDIYAMNLAMNKANEQAQRLAMLNVRIPDVPSFIKGDKITTDVALTRNNPSIFNANMVKSVGSSAVSSRYNTSSAGNIEPFDCVNMTDLANDSAFDEVEETESEYEGYSEYSDDRYTYEDNKLYLCTNMVFPGGIQYNSGDVHVMDGTFSHFLASRNNTYGQWKQLKDKEKNTYVTVRSDFDASSYYGTWYDNNNNALTGVSGITDDVILSTINDYENSIRDIYNTKYRYQVVDLYKLFEIESNVQSVKNIFTVNANDDLIIMY